jgi:hypothetical protein
MHNEIIASAAGRPGGRRLGAAATAGAGRIQRNPGKASTTASAARYSHASRQPPAGMTTSAASAIPVPMPR